MNAQEFLAGLERIPRLLELAIQQTGLRRYDVQEQLRRQHRQAGRPFLYSMPMRHLYTCPLCGHEATDVRHELEDPGRGDRVEFTETTLHQARAHDTPPGDELASFLAQCLQEGGQ